VFEAILRGGARAMRAAFDERDRDEVDRLLALIELDPYEDDLHKFKTLVAPLVMNVYDNEAWRITYRVVHPFAEVYSIRRSDRS
jgi:hypothetical protein